MKGPTAADLLVQQAKRAEQLRIMLLANECKDIQELRDRLSEILEKNQG